ncbi:response regulator [Paenalkalicoccus suaedae]|uniref:Response regulator n=1 Tax=Paenalkalicoccus suaedae TaxID=2592382 RepID=A0A859FJJ9_9BACI|nr:response regulator [Paenalkalicoccus suaedae]QKS72968.1 response regulator [Paenalkalicoccus suaedae]
MKTPTVLIVDDEPKSRDGLKRRLDAWEDYLLHVTTAENAQEALNFINDHDVDLLITDIRMPEMTGLELIEAVKALGRAPTYIVISAYSEFDYAHKALTMGVHDYLLKPVKKDEFLDAVKQALAAKAQLQRVGQVEKVMAEEEMTNQELPPSIATAVEVIHTRLHEKCSLKDVAQEVHLNPSYFSVLFKDHVGMTFSEYLTKKRLQKAKTLLLTSDLPIGEIAERVGYQTAKYFIQLFKEYEKTTPSKYRKLSREDG